MKRTPIMQEKRRPDIARLLGRIPDSDEPGKTSTFTAPDPAMAERVFDEILAGGREAIDALIALVRDPAEEDFKDFRPQYVLHGLALRAGRPGNEEGRRLFAQALASRLDDEKLSKRVKAILIRELQVAGGKEATAALGGRLIDEDLCEPAAQALIAIGGAEGEFRSALPKAMGAGRVTILQALGVLRDAGSIASLKEAANDPDRAVRLAAVWALGAIGDPAATDVLLKASGCEDGWEKVQAVKACVILTEKLDAAGKKDEAKRIYEHLRESRPDLPPRT